MKKTKKLIFASLMAALICIATMVIKIPVPATGGYVNLGDGIIILSGIILGPLYGGLASAIGSGLADIFSGYMSYFLPTFIIKGLMGVYVGFAVKKASVKSVILAGIVAEIIMVGGYFIAESVFLGYGLGALGAIFPNAVQGVFGIVISALLVPVTQKINFKG